MSVQAVPGELVRARDREQAARVVQAAVVQLDEWKRLACW